MNTDFAIFEPPKAAPVVPPAAPAQPQVIVVQTASRATAAAVIASVLAIFSIGCDLGQYIAGRTPAPAPAPAPAPIKPDPIPPAPLPPPAATTYTGLLHASLVYDETSQSDLLATNALRSDASLSGRLKSNQTEWYVIDTDEAKALNYPLKAGWPGKTPVLAIQKDGDPMHTPSFFPAPASSDELIATINKYRGK